MDARHDGDSVLGGLRAPSLNVGVDTPGVGGQASTDFNNKINNRCNNYNSNTDGRKRKLIGNPPLISSNAKMCPDYYANSDVGYFDYQTSSCW